MATKKKQSRSPKAKPVAAAAKTAGAAPRKSYRKEWIVALVFAAIVVGVASQVVFMAKQKASQVLEFVRVGALIQKGAAEGQCGGARAMAPAKDGGIYHLDGEAPNWRLQQFKRDGSFVGRYKPKDADGILNRPHFMSTGDDGRLYIIDRDGRVLILSPAMQQLKVLKIPAPDAAGLAVNSADEIFVLNTPQQRVDVFGQQGQLLRSIGDGSDPKGALTAPLAIFIDRTNEELFVYEAPGGKTRVKVFNAAGAFQRTFFVNVKVTPYSTFGVDAEGRIYFSQLDSGTGVVVYDRKGKYLGSAKSSTDNQMFPDQGYLTVNPWNSEIVMNYAPAVGFFRYQPEEL